MAAGTTRFRFLRNCGLAGRACVKGEEVELTDAEAYELLAMSGTVEPVNAADRKRLTIEPRLSWETAEAAAERKAAAGPPIRYLAASSRK